MYISNGYGLYRKFCPQTGNDFNYSFNETVEPLTAVHPDLTDMCLDTNNNPWLVAGDGGVMNLVRNGLYNTFDYSGGGGCGNGLQALEVTEVNGMYVNSRREYDMYFATQHNHFFASEAFPSATGWRLQLLS